MVKELGRRCSPSSCRLLQLPAQIRDKPQMTAIVRVGKIKGSQLNVTWYKTPRVATRSFLSIKFR